MENGDQKNIENVQYGDKIQVVLDKQVQISEVALLIDHQENISPILNITLESGDSVRVTDDHYMRVEGELKLAREIVPGNIVEVFNTDDKVKTTSRVKYVQRAEEWTKTANLIVKGDVIANNIVVPV